MEPPMKIQRCSTIVILLIAFWAGLTPAWGVSKEMIQSAVEGVELRGGDVDEAPQVYKRLPEVLEQPAATAARAVVWRAKRRSMA